MKWLPETACAILLFACSCGNGQSRVESPTRTDGNVVVDRDLEAFQDDPTAGSVEDGATADDPWADQIERPAGVAPIETAAFVRFLGFEHGQEMQATVHLFPEQVPKLGKRIEIDMAGSVGFKYESHLAAAWETENKRLEFLSVRSDDAIGYFSSKGHSDANLAVLWKINPGAAHGVLGEPTQVINRPHAVTYRYEFRASDQRRGTVSLEFSKLVEPVRCSAVSVHWFY